MPTSGNVVFVCFLDVICVFEARVFRIGHINWNMATVMEVYVVSNPRVPSLEQAEKIEPNVRRRLLFVYRAINNLYLDDPLWSTRTIILAGIPPYVWIFSFPFLYVPRISTISHPPRHQAVIIASFLSQIIAVSATLLYENRTTRNGMDFAVIDASFF